ncbi:MAG: hypothetical protein V3R64_02385 [Sphingomonadales bacterium]
MGHKKAGTRACQGAQAHRADSKVRSMTFRPLARIFFWILLVDVFLLGVVGAMPAEGVWIYIGQFATAYYFLHFTVILYLLGKYEKTRPLPKSISEPVGK